MPGTSVLPFHFGFLMWLAFQPAHPAPANPGDAISISYANRLPNSEPPPVIGAPSRPMPAPASPNSPWLVAAAFWPAWSLLAYMYWPIGAAATWGELYGWN